MGRITGMEAAQNVPPKVQLIYKAVVQLIAEGQDLNAIKVSTITELAGIGKGTAYDYFETKDDIIACALLYQIKVIVDELSNALIQRETLSEQINFLMDEIEKEEGNQPYFLRFIHALTENTSYCQLVRDKMTTEEFHSYMPIKIFSEIVERGVARGEIRADLPSDYVISAVASRMIMYMISLCSADCFQVDALRFRPYIYQGIMDELCEKNV
ncbi:MAG: TetR/AcrR family transcriptional regulator [Lachnospiraceae bacterium]|nr:TetR/AcrR family transcriptional regulator [Lachnospiraceae bacterium]